MAAENGGEVLAGDETGPHHAAVAEDEGEEPDDTLHPRLVSELGLEEGEVRLALLAGRGLKTTLKHLGWCRTDHAQELGDGVVAALKAELAELAPEAPPGQLGEALRPLPQIGLKRLDQRGSGSSRLVGGRLEPASDVLADRLAVVAGAAGDGGDSQPLPGEV